MATYLEKKLQVSHLKLLLYLLIVVKSLKNVRDDMSRLHQTTAEQDPSSVTSLMVLSLSSRYFSGECCPLGLGMETNRTTQKIMVCTGM